MDKSASSIIRSPTMRTISSLLNILKLIFKFGGTLQIDLSAKKFFFEYNNSTIIFIFISSCKKVSVNSDSER